jgi:hypothetical protein
MIDFTTVTREFRSLVDRRRDLQTFLGSGFAAMSVFLSNVLEGKLPPSLRSIQEHVFAFYALVLMVLTLLLSLRLARLHGGLILNGVLYARVLQAAGRAADPRRAARHNLLGVSFLQFVLVDLIAGFSAAILLLALEQAVLMATAIGAAVVLVWMVLYFYFHARAARFGLAKAATDPVGPVSEGDLREHLSMSLQQANQGLITEIAFAGLIVFSGFGALSGLGKIEATQTDLTADFVRANGPVWFAGLMAVTCLFELVIYLRVRVAIGKFSLQLDPTDRPFRPLRLTDSLLGYLLLAFLFAVSLHVLLVQVLADLKLGTVLAIDAAAFGMAVVAEQVTLVVAGQNRPAAVAAATSERPA